MNIKQLNKVRRKKDIKYLEQKESIKHFVESCGYENIIRYMIDDMDSIEDLNNTQSMYLFQLISSLETILQIYPRINNA